jgi:hypothetical protein
MKKTGKRSLEGYKIFPFIACGLIGLFALFVYHLINEVDEVAKRLEKPQSQTLNIGQMETELEI